MMRKREQRGWAGRVGLRRTEESPDHVHALLIHSFLILAKRYSHISAYLFVSHVAYNPILIC